MIFKLLRDKRIIIPCFLVLPMVSHWILPDSIESRLYKEIGPFFFYLPNLFFLFYLFCYPSLGIKKRKFKITNAVNILSIILFVLVFIQLICVRGLEIADEIILIMTNNLSFIYFPLLFFNFPLDKKCLDNTKYIIIPTLLILCFEVILYSLGILTYERDIVGEERAGLYRISTTIGAATGTAIIISMLGMITVCVYKMSNVLRLTLFIITTITLFFTISRGSILVWIGFSAIWIYFNYLYNMKFAYKMRYFILFTMTFIGLSYFGVFDPIIERNEAISNVSTGRFEHYEEVLRILDDSGWIGVGSGMVFNDKSLRNGRVQMRNYVAAHNTYLILLAELGSILFILYLVQLYLPCFYFNYKNALSWGCLLILAINFMTEGVLIRAEFYAPLSFIMMSNLVIRQSAQRKSKQLIRA